MLRNPFYIGLIHMRGSGQTYQGVHQPIISASLFRRVQAILDGKWNGKTIVHNFLFRRLIVCMHCGHCLTGERQRGHVYYRCHTRECPSCTIREEAIDAAIASSLAPISFLDDEIEEIRSMLSSLQQESGATREEQVQALSLKIANITGRLSRLTDAYIDSALSREEFEAKKLALMTERQELDDAQHRLKSGHDLLGGEVFNFFEQLKALPLCYKIGNVDEKRDLLKTIASNIRADGKNVVVKLRSPFLEIQGVNSVLIGPPLRNRLRTHLEQTAELLYKYFIALAEARQRDDYRDVLVA